MYFVGGGYNDDQLRILRQALNEACLNLGITDAAEKARETVAQAMSLANAGQFDPVRLLVYAMDHCPNWRVG